MGVSVTVTIDSELLAQANELGVDITQAVQNAVAHRIQAERVARQWYEENKEAVDSYNAHVAEHGLASQRHGLRRS